MRRNTTTVNGKCLKKDFKRGILTWRETNGTKQDYKATEGEHMGGTTLEIGVKEKHKQILKLGQFE
jgi:hypothetical protein